VSGAPNGVRLALDAWCNSIDTEIVVAKLPPGRYHLEGEIEGVDVPEDNPLHFEIATDTGTAIARAALPPGAPAPEAATANGRVPVQGDLVHAGGPLVLRARLSATRPRHPSPPEPPGPRIWVSSIQLTTKAAEP